MKVKELLSDESKWTKETYARSSDGKPTAWFNQDAQCWCLLGAINLCYGGNSLDKLGMIRYALGLEFLSNAVDWNDHPNRTFSEVKALVEKLDI